MAEVLNKRFGLSYNESAYRKTYQAFDRMFDACKDIFVKSNDGCRELDTKKRELERAKIQFRDERNAWQKQNYNTARVEQKLDYLETVISEQGKIKYDIQYFPTRNDKRAMAVCLSDLHIGACFDSIWGNYNSDIAHSRLAEYFGNVIEIGRRHEISDVVVIGLGDIVSGNIHKSIQCTNRENVIQQIMLASTLITNFIAGLCEHFNVSFINVSGNHSRMDTKEDAIKDERLDDLIGWYVNNSLSHLENFTYIKCEDITIGEIKICNKKYWTVHGDYDAFNRNGLANLVLAKGYKPSGIFCGHLHASAMEDIADIKYIRSGSLCGSGDNYTVEKRLTGSASQTVVICNEEGVECIYPVTLH